MWWFAVACLTVVWQTPTQPAIPKNTQLRQELLAMMKVDQDARKKLVELMKKRNLENHDDTKLILNSEVLKELNEIDARNLKRMKEIITAHGWPGKSLVGQDGASAAWLLVQHCDQDRPFQKKCLELLERIQEGEIEKRHLAYLTDRVLIGEKKKQIYGTQLDNTGNPLPMEEADKVDERRKQMGMETLGEYVRRAKANYGIREKK